MKKGLLLILLMAGMYSFAQQKNSLPKKTILITWSAGAAFPVGDFADKELTYNNEAGLATTGWNISTQFRYRLKGAFGIGASVGYAYHDMDLSKTALTKFGTNRWQYLNIMAGPFISVPINNRWRVDMKSFAGIATVNAPPLAYRDQVLLNEQWTTAVALQLGCNIRYNWGRTWSVLLSTDYNYISANLKGAHSDGVASTTNKKIGSILLNIGAGMRL